MADQDVEEDIFADLYDDNDASAPAKPEPAVLEVAAQPGPESAPIQNDFHPPPSNGEQQNEVLDVPDVGDGDIHRQDEAMHGVQGNESADDYDRPIGIKEDGKMFIGGLNWETTDQSLKDYFSQFGEVIECTVMRDGATGRSRGFGFLTFKDPKTVNIVMVKEHALDGKLIDPKRAIPREEQERTAKIFVGGVSQECTEPEFKEFFMGFGRVLDATLMMDKDTGRPRGFGFVTFDSDAAVDRTLEQPLSIHGKMIEVKRAQPRGNLRDDDGGGQGKFARQGKPNFNNPNQQPAMMDNSQNGGNNMSPAMMAQYWQRMQQYFQVMQQRMAMQNNPAMMQQMMANQGMNPQMMQQMANMQGGGGGGGGFQGMNNGNGSQQGGYNAQEQMMFEQQKYERQQMARMQQGNFQSGNTWEGMYDDVPAPAHMRGGMTGGRGGARGGAGSRSPAPVGSPAGNAPANAPTGPKNAGHPGANYRGGGRGGRRGYHPYARGGG